MTGSQVLMLTKGRASTNIPNGVVCAALVAGARETGRAFLLLRALGFARKLMVNLCDGTEGVNPKREASATVETDDFGAQAARRQIARPTAGGGPDVNPAKVNPYLFGAHLALDGQRDHAKVRALGACAFNVRAGDV